MTKEKKVPINLCEGERTVIWVKKDLHWVIAPVVFDECFLFPVEPNGN